MRKGARLVWTCMNRVFQLFVERLSTNPDAETLRAAMSDVIQAFDLYTFAYLFTPLKTRSDVKIISTYPSGWTGRYLAEGYDRVDPVIMRVQQSTDPFEWGHGLWPERLGEPQHRLLGEAAAFGIRCGLTFPIHDAAAGIAAVTFASHERPPKLARLFEGQKPVLSILAILFHMQARHALAPKRAIAGTVLTAREFECLDWASKGKSAWDTSRIIGLSRRTVAFHLNNAKLKLGVRSIQQAVALFAASRRTRY